MFADCTAGRGGHAAAFAAKVGASGTIILNDLDPSNLDAAAQAVRAIGASPTVPTVEKVHGNFALLPRLLAERGLAADVVLADLGFASVQVDDAARGFSFSKDGPLDMRMDPGSPTTAADLVASLPESELAAILRDYADEKHAGRIARKLVQARGAEPITTTRRLAEVVRSAVGGRSDPSGIDPATRTFQALRIAVNDELGSLEAFLSEVSRGAYAAGSANPGWLRPGARVGIIAFHSLEDRPVKRVFGELEARGAAVQKTSGPVVAGESEVRRNPRARSAKLRVIQVSKAV